MSQTNSLLHNLRRFASRGEVAAVILVGAILLPIGLDTR
jgi:hypothetical protein